MTLVACLDTETTGLSTTEDRIMEIALILQDLETGVEKLRYVRRIDPCKNVAAKALAVHGITNADVMGCPTFAQVAPMLAKILERVDLLVGHNIEGFDIPVVMASFEREGISLSRFPETFDTTSVRGATADGKMPSLQELAWAAGTPYDPALAHAAEYDVLANLAAFRELLRLGVIELPPSISKPTTTQEAA